jgi:GDPmannose 4,6-dehydratase
MFAVNGITFNHDSPRRGSNFVTTKIVKGAKAIKQGKQSELLLGNLDSARDFGHAKDYVKAMYLMMNHKEPDDFVVATGESHTVREIYTYVFQKLGLDCKRFVRQDAKYTRPDDTKELKGDASKARKELGWKPSYNFYTLLDEMIEEVH